MLSVCAYFNTLINHFHIHIKYDFLSSSVAAQLLVLCQPKLIQMLVSGDRFCGLYHRLTNKVHLYTKKGRGKGADRTEYDYNDPELPKLIEAELWEQLQEDVELLEVCGGALV